MNLKASLETWLTSSSLIENQLESIDRAIDAYLKDAIKILKSLAIFKITSECILITNLLLVNFALRRFHRKVI